MIALSLHCHCEHGSMLTLALDSNGQCSVFVFGIYRHWSLSAILDRDRLQLILIKITITFTFLIQFQLLFPVQNPFCLNRKCTCAHLSAHGHIGLKIRCDHTHCWCNAFLRQCEAVALTNKELV